jgi:TatA/E family protein of Tat protein translocase
VPSLGPLEILVIFVVALLVFGPNKLPELARQVGKGLAEFRKVQQHLKGELDDAIHSVMDDDKPKVAPPVTPVTPAAPVTSVAPAAPVTPIAPGEVPPAAIDAASTAGADDTAPESPVDPGPTPPPLADDA